MVMIDGGLGSQMGQYALGLAIEQNSKLIVKHDISWFRHNAKDCNKLENRLFALTSVFNNVKLKLPPENMRSLFAHYLNTYPGVYLEYNPDIITSNTPRYLGGYYCHPQYLAGVIGEARNVFAFVPSLDEKNERVLEQMRATEYPVAVHVRRGDYVGTSMDLCSEYYYAKAFEAVRAKLAPHNPTFFVFSNGLEWAKEKFSSLPYRFVFVDGNDNDHVQFDLYLMTQCSHYILSNSSLSFWGCHLSQNTANKVTIIPEKWLPGFAKEAQDIPTEFTRAFGWETCPVS